MYQRLNLLKCIKHKLRIKYLYKGESYMFQLLAVCPMGLEAVVAREIQELGYETNVENGRIFLKETQVQL